MTSAAPFTNLTNHFLVAMPSLHDALFGRSVVYLCEHSPDGALGIVINKPCDISLQRLFDQVDMPLGRSDLMGMPVFIGGPVQIDRGFVLHEPSPAQEHMPVDLPASPMFASTLSIVGGLEMTTSKDVLDALSLGGGPRKLLISLGYSAWGEGQLESELSHNHWLTMPADRKLIFDTPAAKRWDGALLLLGLQAWMISPEVGHA